MFWRSGSLLLVASLVCALRCPDAAQATVTIWSKTTNNVVTSEVAPGKANWDPADPVTVSGQLREPNWSNCGDAGIVADADSMAVHLVPPEDEDMGRGHVRCVGSHQFTVIPGTDANGNFEFSMKGGGPSWINQDGRVGRGGIVQLIFYKTVDDNTSIYYVWCGNANAFNELPNCASSPPIYGQLTSPDLNGDDFVDSSDLALFASLLGQPITLRTGWQGDYNHSGGPTVDASDLAYFVGRLGKNCNSQKAGNSYAMDIRNLWDASVRRLMTRAGIAAQEILEKWDEMGLSYDHDVVTTLLAGGGDPPVSIQPIPWGAVKTLYR